MLLISCFLSFFWESGTSCSCGIRETKSKSRVCCEMLGPVFAHRIHPMPIQKVGIFGWISSFSSFEDKLLLPISLAFIGVLSIYFYARKRYDSRICGICLSLYFCFSFFCVCHSSMGRICCLSSRFRSVFLHTQKWFFRLLILLLAAYWSPRTTDNILLMIALMTIYVQYKNTWRHITAFIASLSLVSGIVFFFSDIHIGYYQQELLHQTSQTGFFLSCLRILNISLGNEESDRGERGYLDGCAFPSSALEAKENYIGDPSFCSSSPSYPRTITTMHSFCGPISFSSSATVFISYIRHGSSSWEPIISV